MPSTTPDPNALTDTERFFYDNAGYSWDSANGQTEEQGHLESARALADAETRAEREGFELEWEEDPEYPGEFTVTLLDEGYTIERRRGIDSDDDVTRRVVAAQLALEAFDTYDYPDPPAR